MNKERGQALPMAILALAIGALVVTPFLSHAGTSLLDSRSYGESISMRDASDAGVEHAIWGVTLGTLAEQIPDTGDQITYDLPETLNGLITTVTVTTNASTSGGGVIGEIDDTIIDTHNFDDIYCNTPRIIHVSGDVYAIAYQGSGTDGYVTTMEIYGDGQINGTIIDTLEFDTSDCDYPDIIHVTGDVYAVAYTGSGNDGFVKTFTISAAGQISDSVIDLLEYDTSNGYESDIILVSGIYYAVAYRGTQSDGFLVTMTISAVGDISNSVVDSYEFDPSNCYTPDIENISGSVYAIAYSGVGNDGFLVTLSINASGVITKSIIDTLEFDTTDCGNPDILQISGDVYAVAYDSSGNDGFLATMTVTAAGVISNSVISSFEFDTSNGQTPKITWVTGNVYAIVYDGPQDDGYIITLPIESDGTIPGTIISTLEYDTSNGYYPSVIMISDGILAVAYCIPSSRGSVVTLSINTVSETPTASYEILSTAGDVTIRAYITTENGTATIIYWYLE